MSHHILLVEDDVMIASGLVYALEKEGYIPTHCRDVRSAYEAIHAIQTNPTKSTNQTNQFDLAILDMQLPDGTGFDVSQRLKDTNTAIIFLTIGDVRIDTKAGKVYVGTDVVDFCYRQRRRNPQRAVCQAV